jgi:hypothetical protein
MRKDKEFIFRLRREGKSYRDIQQATGVSRGTLCQWFKSEDWSKHLTTKHSDQSIQMSKDRMIKMNMVRKLKLQYQYALVEKEAEKDYETYKNETLFWAGLMLYAGEGDKKSRNLVGMSSSVFYTHRVFGLFCEKYLYITRNNLRRSLTIYPDSDPVLCKHKWVEELGAQTSSFYKTQIIKGRETNKTLQFGICTTIISSTSLKLKILKWISLAGKEQF